MDILGVVVLAVLAIPVALLYALYRISELASAVEELERQVSYLRREAYGARADAGTSAGERRDPRPEAPEAAPGPETSEAAAAAQTAPGPPEATPSEGTPPGLADGETTPHAEPTTPTRARRPDIPAALRSAGTGKLFEQPLEAAPPGEGAGPGEAPPGDAPPSDAPPADAAADRPDDRGTRGREPETPEAEPAPAGLDLEAVIGSTWLLRVGLGILAIALALFARLVAPQLSPPAKVALAYAGAVAFFGFGKLFEDRLERFARPVMAGGLAFGFFVAYAAHFVPAMEAVSLPVSIGWMAVSMLTLLVAAESWRSESTAILAVILGHVSAQVSAGAADIYSLVMIGFLALTALILLLRHGWIQLGLLGVAASYGAHLLWMLADRQAPVGNEGFWLSLAFLTSYYLIFLVADILWWHRDPEVGEGEDARRILRDARALGPTNLVLYVSLTTFLYLVSDGMVDAIEWYYLTVGALQGALAWLYRDLDHGDFVYYPAFGTVLWTLGLFAALDALVLNLVLASQALLLLLVARRTGLRVFYLLSQGMMAATFVHYVAYPAPAPGFGVLLGGLAVASVYLAKAYLEEDWYRISLLPELHAAVGGIVILRESVGYFGALGTDRSLGLFVATAQLLLAVVVLWRARPTLLFAVTTMAVGLPLADGRVGAGGIWTASMGFVVTVLLLVFRGPGRVDASRAVEVVSHARAIAVLVLAGAFLTVQSVAPGLSTYLLWMLLPVGLAAAQVGTDRFSGTEARPDWLATATYVALGLVVVFLTGEATSTDLMEPVWAWIWSSVAFGAFGIVRARGLTFTGYTLLFVGALAFLHISLLAVPELGGTSHPALATWWSAGVLVAVPLAIGWGMDRHLEASAASPGIPDVTEAEGFLATLAPYLLGLLVVGAVAAETGALGWIYLAPALIAALLLAAGNREKMQAPVIAAVLGVGLWHLHFLTLGARAGGVGSASVLLLAFAVVTLVVERGAFSTLETERDRQLLGPVLLGLVLMAALTGMVAVYTSDLMGGQWTTVGWSVWGGAIMAAAFFLRSAVHRRVALAVLVVCVARVFAVDTVGLSDTARIGAFLVLGLVLVGIALLYNRYSTELKSWL